MARLLACAILKCAADVRTTYRPTSKLVSGPFFWCDHRYSTTTSSGNDTHEDFQPINKLASLSAREIVEKDVKESPIIIYMKGVPDAPQCGFSQLAVRVLKSYGVPFSARNILEDAELKSGVKAYSNWPTFPQVFIKGEFIGGSDIILNMHQTGELKEKLRDVVAVSDAGNAG